MAGVAGVGEYWDASWEVKVMLDTAGSSRARGARVESGLYLEGSEESPSPPKTSDLSFAKTGCSCLNPSHLLTPLRTLMHVTTLAAQRRAAHINPRDN